MTKEKLELEDLVAKAPKSVLKRDGKPDDFDEEAVADAIFEAAKYIGGHDQDLSKIVARKVRNHLAAHRNGSDAYKHSGKNFPGVEDVQDAIELVLRENEFDTTAHCYALYRKRREKVREKKAQLRVSGDQAKGDTTDAALLLVDTLSKENTAGWDRDRIVVALLHETELTAKEAKSIAKSVENTIFLGNYKKITTHMIKEVVNAELLARGYTEVLKGQEILGMSVHDLEAYLFAKSVENSNIGANNPEANNMAIAEDTFKKYALKKIFSSDVSKAHLEGRIHLHDLGMPTRVYCSSHSIEYLKKFGLNLENLQSKSSPGKHALSLFGHLQTFIASMQAYYAGALGIGYINVLPAPILAHDMKDVTDPEKRKEILKQNAQFLIYSGAQNAFSRGGQTVFLDFNVHAGVPGYLKDVPAIGPGGKYMLRDKDGKVHKLTEVKKDERLKDLKLEDRVVFTEKWRTTPTGREIVQEQVNLQEGEKVVTYGDYEDVAQEFAMAMLEIWEKGDRDGMPFAFPKCDFHVDKQALTDSGQRKVFEKACEVAAKNGSTYFVFDRDAATMSACCRLRTTVSDNEMIKHPESMRFCGFQNVTMNLPRMSYRVGKNNWDGIYKEIDDALELIVKAHLQKKEFISKLRGPGSPQWQTGMISPDGLPYIDLDKATYIVGILGLNEMVQHQTGN
ncbi:hypothetical protein KY316_03400, partial [Candidatus Woesearchaeota archaeon]|nr:hypothetical protein [Candidatus Woesearchaeota archaeon]